MPRNHLMLTSALALALTGLALDGCNQQTPAPQQAAQPITGAPLASLGLATAPPPAVLPPAPGASQLPAAGPIRVAARRPPAERYRYIDDAYDMTDAFGDSPPDYTVDYQGTRPWVWRAQSGAYRVVEQTPDGERDYYYGPYGDQPFLIRDPQYAYAYDGGELVEVYDSYGRPARADIAQREADIAGRYLSRARALYFAAQHQQRQAAYAAEWRDRREAIAHQREEWAADQQRNDDWRRWHENRAAEDHGAWVQERSQRQNYAAQVTALVAAGAAGAALQHSHDQDKAHAADMARQQQAQADAARLGQQQQQMSQARQQQAQMDAARNAQAQAAQAQAAQAAQAMARQQQQAQIDAARRADAQSHANGQQALARQQADAANAQRAAQAQAVQNAQLTSHRQAEVAAAQRNAQVAAQQHAEAAARQQAEAANAQHAAQAHLQQQQAEAANAQRAQQAAQAEAQRAGQARQQAEAANAQRAAQMHAQQAQQQAQAAARQQAEAANAQRAAQMHAQQAQAQNAAHQQAEAAQHAAQVAAAREQAHGSGKPPAAANERKKPENGPQQ